MRSEASQWLELPEILRSAVAQASEGDLRGALEALLAQGPEPGTGALSKVHPLQAPLQQGLKAGIAVADGRFQEALLIFLTCTPVLESSPLASSLDWLYSPLAYALGRLGDPARGLEWAARALAVTESRPSSSGRSKALNAQGALLAMLSQHAAAWTALSAAHEVAVRQALPRATVVSMSNLAFCCVDEALSLHPEQDAVRRAELGARALPIATEALALAQQHELTVLGGFAAISLGFGHLLCGDLAQAHAVLLQAKHWTAEHSTTQVDALFGLAMVSRLLHKTEEAKALLARAEGMAQARGLLAPQGRILEEGVQLALQVGDTAAALAWSQRCASFWKMLHTNHLQLLARNGELFAEVEQRRHEAEALRAESRAWADAALHDPLTGALNRRGLDAFAQAHGPEPMAVALVDADHFKSINDELGHAFGDAVLLALADLLRQQLRRGDALARMGGEEFVLLWPRTDAEAALAAGERLRAAVATHDWAALDPALQVRVSVGLALRLAGEDLDPAIARADAALYRAKAAGRNRVSAPTVWGELPPA